MKAVYGIFKIILSGLPSSEPLPQNLEGILLKKITVYRHKEVRKTWLNSDKILFRHK